MSLTTGLLQAFAPRGKAVGTTAAIEQSSPGVKAETSEFIRMTKTRNNNISNQENINWPNWVDKKIVQTKDSMMGSGWRLVVLTLVTSFKLN